MKTLFSSSLMLLLAGATDLAAQTVQLPSIHYFATNSSVLVPDQGQVSLGGINSASSGRSQFNGLPGNFSRGNAGQAGGVTVTAFVHDFDAWDQALLAAAARRRQSGVANVVDGRGLPPAAADAPLASIAQIEAARRAAQADPARQAQDYFARARQAQTAGQSRLARVYYQMSARRATGELREQALAEIASISSALAPGGKAAPR